MSSRHPAARAAPPTAEIPLRQRAEQISERLARAIPAPRIELDFEGPWQLLVAAILSAQSTERVVNTVTPGLFRRFPAPADLGAAAQEEVEAMVKPTGFFRNKARAIREASRAIAEHHGGRVPRTMDELTALRGVARKTANVVLGSGYGIASGIVVDTHVGRVARRLGLTAEDDPVKVELDLCELIPAAAWIETSLRLQLHGRHVCTAQAPRCAACPLNELCPGRRGSPRGSWADRAERERELIASRGEQGGEQPR